jgi:hypothetical protein
MPIQQTTITKELPMTDKDSPGVLAYRVGELEISVKEGVGQLNGKLDTLLATFAQKEDLLDLEKRVVKLETKDGFKNTLLWVGLVSSAIINIVFLAKTFGAL